MSHERRSHEKGDFTRRLSRATDIGVGEKFDPLPEEYKPGSTRARFEELVSTYRSTHDSQGRALSMLDGVDQKRASFLQLVSMVKNGELPPTSQITGMINQMDFDKMRKYATTFQGKKVIDNMENSTQAGVRAFEEINGEENAQVVVKSLDNARKKSLDDRKKLASKAKKSSKESKPLVTSAGKDFLVLANGISTSSAFRKAATDLTSLINATIQNKAPKEEGAQPLVDRVRNLVVEVRQNANVQKSLRSLESLYTTTYSKGIGAARDVRDQAAGHPATEDLNVAREHTQDIFQRLGNGYDLGPMIGALGALATLYRDNENVGQIVDEIKDFGSWAMNVEEEKLTSDEFETRSQEILDKGRNILTDKDRENIDTLSKETEGYMAAVQANPVLVEYKDAMVGLVHSIAGDNLNAEERQEHYRALRQDVLANLPVLMQSIRYVPVPRVSGMNKQLEFAADNIVLDLKRFIPEHMSFDYHSEVYPRASLLKDKKAMRSRMGYQGEQFFYLTITGVNCVAKRVAFYLKKKKGMPRLAEKGIADLIVGGRGMDIHIRTRKLHESEKPRVAATDTKASASSGDPTGGSGSGSSSTQEIRDGKVAGAETKPRAMRQLEIVDVKVKLHDLDIRVHENKHNISSTLGILLMKPVAKKLLARTMAKAMTDYLIEGDKIMAKYGGTAQGVIVGHGKKAMASAKSSAQKGVKAGKSKYQSMKSKSGKAKDKAESAADSVAAKHEQQLQQEQRRDSLVEEQGY
ncbi:hypothetical protein LPJ53_003920 [Coemansia erecta]|uniref:HAM1-like N-terminal domain-containing protein n=1 Tax=Coemansia erecta TaxID=147472 RepID=A0A9W7XVC2_9FUNG|nr:hypothetical protein LPJ53_003920 [Coemansia erecta]